jgi:hypothetical protein
LAAGHTRETASPCGSGAGMASALTVERRKVQFDAKAMLVKME